MNFINILKYRWSLKTVFNDTKWSPLEPYSHKQKWSPQVAFVYTYATIIIKAKEAIN